MTHGTGPLTFGCAIRATPVIRVEIAIVTNLAGAAAHGMHSTTRHA
jgi:hypothetical protein